MDIPKTVGTALERGIRALTPLSETPHLDSQLLLSEVLSQPRAWVLAHPEAELERERACAFSKALSRCRRGEALPYVLGWWEFYGRRFRVTPAVMIPRPETEQMVEAALAFLSTRRRPARALDVGTGSGCVAVTLALEAANVAWVASDVSHAALQVARHNAIDHDVSQKVSFLQADLTTPMGISFDLVCANLPYIPTESLHALEVARREPTRSLDGGRQGLALLRRMLAGLPRVLSAGGRGLLELGEGQGATLLALAREMLPQAAVSLRADLAGRERLLVIDREAEA